MTNKSIEEQLTAYVLGELSDEEQETIEKLLETDEDAQFLLQEMRVTVGLSREALKTQPSVALWPEQRTAIKRATASPTPARVSGGRGRIPTRRLALAASFLLIFGGLGWVAWVGLGASRVGNMQMAEVAIPGKPAESFDPNGNKLVVPDPDFGLDQLGLGSGRGVRLNGEELERLRTLGYLGGTEDSRAPGAAGPDGSAVVRAARPQVQQRPVAEQTEILDRSTSTKSAQSSDVPIAQSLPQVSGGPPPGLTAARASGIAGQGGADKLEVDVLQHQQILGTRQTEVRTRAASGRSAQTSDLSIEQRQVQFSLGATGEDSSAQPTFEAFDPESIGPLDESLQLSSEEHNMQKARELVELAEQYLEFQFHDRAVENFQQVLLIAPDNTRAQKGLHEATLGAFQEETKELQSGISKQAQSMRREIQQMKLLPEGADSRGLRNPRIDAPRMAMLSDGGGGGFGGGGQGGGGGSGLGGIVIDSQNGAFVSNGLGGFGGIDSQDGIVSRNGIFVPGGPGGFGGVAKKKVIPLLGDLSQQTDPQTAVRDGVEVRVRIAGLPSLRYYHYQTLPSPRTPRTPGTESYTAYSDNGFVLVGNEPLSTFSIDVDTASYANMRRFLRQGQLPPPDAVRVEELINYFDYAYAGPEGEAPFAAHMTVASAPWRPEHRLVRIALKGADMTREERPAANLVFLLDVSGSMKAENKLPLVKRAIALLVRQLTAADRVAMVTYAGSSGLALPSTRGDRQDTVLGALERLEAGGSTNGGAGIELAYRVASENFVPGGINRVILATDGDFNVGITNRRALEGLIEDKARGGVFLTALGFGMGNLKDSTLETLSNKGNGNYAYIDTIQEARKVFVEDLMGTLVTIAKDVKIQVEFNPQQVAAYRLIGYENRALAPQDFNDDAKDAGEIGAGHTVTALYEIVPAGMTPPGPSVDPLRYRQGAIERPAATLAPTTLPVGIQKELLTLKVRYKEPEGSTSKLLTFHLTDPGTRLASAPADFKFAAGVASFGQMLRQSPHVASMDYNSVLALAEDGMAADLHGYRAEFIDLLRMARPLMASTYRTSPVPQISPVDLQLLNFQEVSAGTWRVRIRSASRRGWYSEGDAFEAYEILSIDPVSGCIIVFVEELGRRVEICK